MTEGQQLICKLVNTLSAHTGERICIQPQDDRLRFWIEALPFSAQYHTGPVCSYCKHTDAGRAICTACKFDAVERAKNERKPFSAYCAFGLTEIVHPVILNGTVAAVIFIGNLLTDETVFRSSVKKQCEKLPFSGHTIGLLLPQLCHVGGDLSLYFEKAEILDAVLRMIESRERFQVPHETRFVSQDLEKQLISYLRTHRNHAVCAYEFAAELGISEAYFSRLFKKQTGVSFSAYCNQYRIRYACELLENTAKPVLQISMESGFDDVSHFNHEFQKRCHMTPTAYRKKKTVPE